ncbi:hypothetical protein BU23DRAFT_235629 [Bimuria novae-zelandiae CBS 107.79]|uniref:Uncharacterized protein n=1 Tax=Bimuria novae-zelandiae CBS 107.79 TaxID=1447943 RepID=A0A6A5V0V4_9PLEO|nr:hypothetical protein BU23DRAFT_235629 [Bimuria novae-zelandiae CBS 107.79]
MLVNITSVSKSQQTTDTAESDSLRAMEEREGSRIGTGPMSTRELRASLKNRYHTIRPSILPLPNNSSGTKALSRVKFYVDRATIRRVPSSDCVIAAGLQEVIATPIAEDPEDAEDAEDLKSSATSSVSAGLAGNGASAQSNVEEQDTRPNDNVGATSHETSPPSTEVSDETEELADSVLPSAQPNTGKDDTEEDADSLVSLSQRSTKNDDTAKLADTTPSPAHPDAGNSKPPEDARPDSPVEQAIKPPQKPPAAPGMITHWITHLPQNLTPIEMPLNPSPSSVPRSDADDVDAITTAIPKLYQGNTTRVNDIPVGREDQHGELPLDEVEVAEARVQTQEATAARQQVALGKDSELRQMKKRRYGFKRLWKKLRSKDGGGQTGNEA